MKDSLGPMTEPSNLKLLKQEAERQNFPMSCDDSTGAFLRALAATKPMGTILELGTGVGVSTAWLLDGLASGTRLVSVERDKTLSTIAKSYLGADLRIAFHIQDATEFLHDMTEVGVQKFDLIFADAPPGKYRDLDKTVELLDDGGIVIFDDMRIQHDWRSGRVQRVQNLKDSLRTFPALKVCELDIGSGLVLAVKGDLPPRRRGRMARLNRPSAAMNDQ